MLKVGITGGIGSGKTSMCKLFSLLDIPIYHADVRAKELMVSDPRLKRKIRIIFGDEAYLPDGKLNRSHIANIVFYNKSKLEALNDLVHPAVAEDSLRWHNSQSDVPYTLKDAALLFESHSYRALDYIITVFAPEELRIKRVMARDGLQEHEVKARIRRQMSEEEKMKMADFVLYNGRKDKLIPQIVHIHDQLLEKGGFYENWTGSWFRQY
ncbi:MAG: dephospho-CoA kinase [Bacteroidota bacterium]